MMHRLIYTSEKAPYTTDADFRMIAVISALWNKQHGITGLLMVYKNEIMQVLEGPKDAVKDLAEKISRDTRHTDMTIVYEKSVDSADFTEWSMGFRPLNSRDEMEVFFNLTRAELAAYIPENTGQGVRNAVSGFADSVGLD